jgi:hypothetical protein
MIDNLIRDVQLLSRADSLIGKIWVQVIARRFGLFAFAGLIAVFGLGMANVAGFYALQAAWGPVWAAALVALADFVLAAIIVLAAKGAKPGPELELAHDVRKMALDSIQSDARDIKLAVDAIGRDLAQTKDTIAGFLHHPFDAATERLLIPAVLSIIRSLRAKKQD